MKRIAKYLRAVFYRPFLVRYLSKTRRYTFKGIRLLIHPEVFHPAFFFSTKYLLRYLSYLPLAQRTFLELGAGSGLIALFAAREGARVVASDINPAAVEYLEMNRHLNNMHIEVIHSDLFEQIPMQKFDIIVINPPYFRKKPVTYADHAWYCGENGEYFERLFCSLPAYMHINSIVLMILSDACELSMIREMARKHGCRLVRIATRRNLIEKNFIFRIERC